MKNNTLKILMLSAATTFAAVAVEQGEPGRGRGRGRGIGPRVQVAVAAIENPEALAPVDPALAPAPGQAEAEREAEERAAAEREAEERAAAEREAEERARLAPEVLELMRQTPDFLREGLEQTLNEPAEGPQDVKNNIRKYAKLALVGAGPAKKRMISAFLRQAMTCVDIVAARAEEAEAPVAEAQGGGHR
jgi:flagellar biosynthesis GTPase FlhF